MVLALRAYKSTPIQFSIVPLYGFQVVHYKRVRGITQEQHWQGIYLYIYVLTWESIMSLAASWWMVNISITVHRVHFLPPLLTCKCIQNILPFEKQGNNSHPYTCLCRGFVLTLGLNSVDINQKIFIEANVGIVLKDWRNWVKLMMMMLMIC